MVVNEFAGEGLPADELEAGLGGATAAPRGAAAATALPVVGSAAASAVWMTTHEKNCYRKTCGHCPQSYPYLCNQSAQFVFRT